MSTAQARRRATARSVQAPKVRPERPVTEQRAGVSQDGEDRSEVVRVRSESERENEAKREHENVDTQQHVTVV